MSLKRARSWPGQPPPKRGRPPKPRPAALVASSGPTLRRAPPDLRPYQAEGVAFLAAHGWRVLLADGPGCGKTAQVLMALRANVAKLAPALAIVPASVLRNWAREAAMWIGGSRIATVGTLAAPLDPKAHLTLTTWDVAAARADEMAAAGFQYILADEAHYARNPDTQRAQGLAIIAETAPYLVLMTGTPILNDQADLDALLSLYGAQRPPVLRRLLEDVAPDIPPKSRVYLSVEMPQALRDEYEQVMELFGDWLREYLPKAIQAGEDADDIAERALNHEALAKLVYLRRVLGRGKAPAAAAWISERVKEAESVVVFAHYSDVLDILGGMLSKLGIAYVRVDGAVAPEARSAAVDAFQAGSVPVFLASSAAREGITLTRARHLLRLERDWVPAYEEQAEDRIRRIGQKHPTTITYLHAEDTLDERITEIVDEKRALTRRVIGCADVPATWAPEVYRAWRDRPELAVGVPSVASSPRGSVALPKLPTTDALHALVIEIRLWPPDAVQRELRAQGYRQRSVQAKDGRVKVECRSPAAFVEGTLRPVLVAPGMVAIVGRPARDGAERMRALRTARILRSL